jgi:oxygen-independent coproporphyrinogen-3 oxidase
MIGLYIHVPFCRTRCPYCDFVSEAVPGAPPDAYVDALVREIGAHAGDAEAASVFFGGGTPSLLAEGQLARILAALHGRFRLDGDAEITLEANPDDLRTELPKQWRALGINRISLGVQSLDNRMLRYLGRRHDADTALRAIGMVSAVFDNWNMDLIFGAPPAEAWAGTLAQSAALRPPHVAAYGLTYEPDTPFGARAGEAMEEDAALEMYRAAEAALAEWDHYEISNFALADRQCRHNLVYWHNEEYAGFGTGAYSFINGVRARNRISTSSYLAGILGAPASLPACLDAATASVPPCGPGGKEESLLLTGVEIRLETVIQHLRLRAGLERAYYARRFGRALDEDFGAALRRLVDRGLIEDDGEAIRPTAQGFYLNNEIGLELVGGN